MAKGVCKILWLKRILQEMDMLVDLSMKLYYDNKVCYSYCLNSMIKPSNEGINRHFVEEKINEGITSMSFDSSSTPQKLAVILLNKGLFPPNFELIVSWPLWRPYAPN